MIFVVDIGNTHIVAGCYDENGPEACGRFRTDKEATSEEYAVKYQSWLTINRIDPKTIEGAIISTVVPQLITTQTEALTTLFGKKPFVVGPGVKSGLNIRIDNPAQLGADMVVAAVAAVKKYDKPILLYDLGTATTISIIDENSVFRGGIIMAGVKTALNSLTKSASLLPDIDLSAPKNIIGTNTVDCMKSGSIIATAAMMDGMSDRLEEEIGAKATLVATGGLASVIVPHCKKKFVVDDDLILEGLWEIYKRNASQSDSEK